MTVTVIGTERNIMNGDGWDGIVSVREYSYLTAVDICCYNAGANEGEAKQIPCLFPALSAHQAVHSAACRVFYIGYF